MWHRDVSNGNSAAGSQKLKEKNPSSNRPAKLKKILQPDLQSVLGSLHRQV